MSAVSFAPLFLAARGRRGEEGAGGLTTSSRGGIASRSRAPYVSHASGASSSAAACTGTGAGSGSVARCPTSTIGRPIRPASRPSAVSTHSSSPLSFAVLAAPPVDDTRVAGSTPIVPSSPLLGPAAPSPPLGPTPGPPPLTPLAVLAPLEVPRVISQNAGTFHPSLRTNPCRSRMGMYPSMPGTMRPRRRASLMMRRRRRRRREKLKTDTSAKAARIAIRM